MVDHYQVLGVERESTQEIISAAYRALAKAFHPDVFKGDRHYAETRLKAINTAYEVIGDPARRHKYDREIASDKIPKSQISDDWRRASQFFPEIADLDKSLAEVSDQLSADFRQMILKGKAFKNAEEIHDYLLDKFSIEKFGRNKLLQSAGLTALRMGKHRLALSINQACSLIGDGDSATILTTLAQENYEDAKSVYLACGLESYLSKKNNKSYSSWALQAGR